MEFFLIILLSALIFFTIWWCLRYLIIKSHLSKYGGPPILPFIGNAHLFNSTTDIISNLMTFSKEHGGSMRVMLGHYARLVIFDYKLAEFMLSSTTILEKSFEYKFFHTWLGTGLLTSSGEKWKRRRKLITPTFHFKILEQFVDVFNSQGETLLEILRPHADGDSFDIFPYANLYALDVICEAAMGTQVNAQKYSDSEYVTSVKEMCRIVVDRSINPYKFLDCTFALSKDYQKQKKALSVLHGYTNSVIKSRRNELLEKGGRQIKEDDMGIKAKLTFLDLLLQSSVDGEPLSDESIREEVDTFMFEGHDTTTSGISFTFYCLSRNADVQEKVVSELKEIFGDDPSRETTYKDLQDMKYLEMVIKESLRLYPPVPIYARVLEENVKFDGGILPKGLCLTLFAFGLHRDPQVFPDPEKFDPERFSLENCTGRNPYAYAPFSGGPRNCIGQRFAMLEIKSVVSKVLRNFKLLPASKHEPILAAEAILKSANGLKIRLSERRFI